MGDSLYGYDDTEDSSLLSRVGVSTKGELITVDGLFLKEIDEASGTALYIGEARPNSSKASAVWRIRRVATAGSAVTIAWADGNTYFDNIWNNRVSKTYS